VRTNVSRFLVAITALAVLVVSRANAQQPDSLLRVRSLRFPGDSLRLEIPDPLLGEGRLVSPRPDPLAIARRWADSVRRQLGARRAARWRVGVTGMDSALFAVAPPAPAGAVPEAPPLVEAAPPQLTILQRYADLGILLNARFELRMDRLKNLRCLPSETNLLSSGCNAAFSPPRLDPQFNVRTGGIVGQRLHLNVDYNSQREFEASNNIQVYYQGLEDEIIRRVEVGNVTFTAPNSRFITGGIPANNFGFRAEAQVGPLNVSGIFAQQKGNVVRGRTFTIGQQTLQPIDRQVMDRDYEPERFFFVVDPATLPGYPSVDVLNLGLAGLSPHTQVVQVRVYRRRASLALITTQQNLGGIPAVALRPDSPQRAGPFPWELLIEGRDYYLDPSGLWFALTNRLDLDDYLAVSYITAAGDTVGTFPAAAQAGRTDTLRLIYEPRRGADVPTFRYEMRNAYRLGSASDVVRDGVELRILVAESERPASGAATFLALLGLAQATDQTQFDQFNRLFPRQRDPGGGAPLSDLFIIFPSLQPFADSTLLSPQFRNDSLYRTPNYLLRTQGPTPLYTLELHYQASGGGDRSTLSLGNLNIRPGSEQLVAGGRPLTRNVDYTINYEIGQVTFLHPDSLFASPTNVTVQYEEQPEFATAPTSIYGLQTRYDLGDHGSVTALGLLQHQNTTFTRPTLGFEPSSNFIGGISGSFRFEPMGLTRLLNALPLVHTTAPSLVTLDAELATSRPSPNQVGTAWVETFEGEGGTFLSLSENSWQLGSRPASAQGLTGTGVDPVAGFQDADAAPLVWQNLVSNSAGGIVRFTAQDIDPSIVLQGTGTTAEPVLWLALLPDTVGGLPSPATGRPRWLVPHTPGPRWRSITSPLSATGTDLSRVEFLEFWVFEDPQLRARSAGTTVVFDFGRVFEDAVDFVPAGFTTAPGGDTVYSGRRRIGEGRLDTERDTLTGSWNALINDNGILGAVADSIVDAGTGAVVHDLPLCESALARGLVVYPWGDQRSRCTRHNGVPDTEDLDNDGHLDTLVAAANESYFRYVFHLGDQRYFVRDGGPSDSSGGRWRLYRIPFRSDTTQVGLPDIRQIRSIRLTVITPDQPGGEQPIRFALSRVRLVGAPWLKRAETPIAGLSGAVGTGHGEVVASIVSTENHVDLGYDPPPGVVDQGATTTGTFAVGTVQINERSLRLIGRDVRPGERAEAYFLFPEGERNFLGYRQLRVWARGRGGGWDNNQLSFYVKVGQDENNFYMYRTHVHSTTWLPDVAVDFNQWLALRALIEQRFLSGQPPSGAAACGGDTLAYVACDSARSYIVQVRNPGVAPPNLARVHELAVGFVRDSGAAADSAELWVDDIRLSQVVNNAGYAGALSLRVAAADVGELDLSLTRRDAQFRQLGEDPTYVTSNQLSLGTTVRLERLGLERLGLTAPFAVHLDQSSSDPYLLSGTDVLASPLAGLRRPRASQTSYSLSVRRSRRGSLWWQRWFVDNIGLNASLSNGSTTTQLSQSATRLANVGADYAVLPAAKSVRYVPNFLVNLLRGLPLIGRADFVRALAGSRLRWSPVAIRLSSGFSGARADVQTFRVPIATLSDTLTTTVHTVAAALRNQASLELRPVESASLSLNYLDTRDLKDYGDSTTIGALARGASRRFLGLNLGFERERSLATVFSYTPSLFSWLRPRFSTSSSFSMTRDPNASVPERTQQDTAGGYRLPTAFTNARSTDLSASLDFSRALRVLLGDSSKVRSWLDRFNPLDVATHSDVRSQFDRPGFDPGLGFQLGLGGGGPLRSLNGVPAASASSTRQLRLSSGLRMPLGISLVGGYGQRTQHTWARRGIGQAETDQSDTQWPDVTARWVWTPPRFLRWMLSSMSASGGYRLSSSETVQPPLQLQIGTSSLTTNEVRSTQETRSWPVSLTVIWAPRITTSLSLTKSRGEALQAGNSTLTTHDDMTANVAFSFRPPKAYLPLPSDVRTALRYTSSSDGACMALAVGGPCIGISQSSRHQFNLSMDTEMPPNVSAGLSLGYILTEDAHIDRKFSQIVITLAVTVNYQAGTPR
jgi:hypothetical protein